MGCCRPGCVEPLLAEGAEFPQQHGQKPLPQVTHAYDMLAVLASRGVAAVGKPTTAADLHAFWVFLLL